MNVICGLASGWRGSYCGRRLFVVEQVTLVEVPYEYASSTGEERYDRI